MDSLGNLFLSILVAVILLGGPLTLFVAIKLLNSAFGSLKTDFVKLVPKEAGDPTLGLRVNWDEESFEVEIFRIKLDFYELIPNGRAFSHSFTFEGKAAKKRSFLLPLKLSTSDIEMLTDKGLMGTKNAIERSSVQVEIENTRGEVVRFKVPKAQIQAAVLGAPFIPDGATIDVAAAKAPDDWSLQTRVFPWRVAVAEAAPADKAKAHGAPKAKTPGVPVLVDFIVTKVWIEPGCIVCDACENEAPTVFHVLADTCIVRENAPLDDGASIQAAAEGCPVDVIKYDTRPKA